MSWTFIHRDITSDLTLNDGQFYHSLLGETGTQAVISSGNIEAQTTFQGFAFTPEGIPGTAGATGDYTIRQEIIDGDADILISIRLYRLNAAGAVQAQSDISDTQPATAGVKTFNFTNLDLGTWTEGDRFAVEYIFFNSRTHPGERSVTFSANTLSDDVVTPFDAGAEPVDVEMDASPGLYSVAGMAATLATTILLSASPGSYAVDGADSTPSADRVMGATAGSYAADGSDASTLFDRFSNAEPGEYVTTGQVAGLTRSHIVSADSGSHVITGVNAELDEAGSGDKPMANVQRGSFSLSSVGSGTVTVNAVDKSKSMLIVDFNNSTENSPQQVLATSKLLDDTTIEFTRGGNTGTVVWWWELIEHQDLSVQHISGTVPSDDLSHDVAITEVDVNKSFLLVNSRVNTSPDSRWGRGMVTAEFVNVIDGKSSTVRIMRGQSGTASPFELQVVTLDNAMVQHGTFAFSGQTTVNQSINVIDDSESLLVFSQRHSMASTAPQRWATRGQITSNDQLTFNRTQNTEGDTNITWHVITHPSFSVQRNTLQVTSGEITANVGDIDYSKSFRFVTTDIGANHTYISEAVLLSRLSSSLQSLVIEKDDGGTATNNVDWQVVEIDDAEPPPGVDVDASPGSYGVTGQDTGLLTARVTALDVGGYGLSGSAVSPLRSLMFATDPGDYTKNGVDLTAIYNRLLSGDSGGYIKTGVNAELVYSADTETALDASPGSYSLTGRDTGLLTARIVSLDVGGYGLTGSAVSPLRSLIFATDPGSYTKDGVDLTAIYNRLLSGDSGGYIKTGVNAELVYSAETDTVFNASSGSYVVTGSDTGLLRSLLISATAGEYGLTGSEMAAIKSITLGLGSGSYAITGSDARLLRDAILSADVREYSISGIDATLGDPGLEVPYVKIGESLKFRFATKEDLKFRATIKETL